MTQHCYDSKCHPGRGEQARKTKHLAKMQLHFSSAPGQLSGAWAVSIAGLILHREGLPSFPGVGSGVQRVLMLHQLGGPGRKLPAASTLRETTFSRFPPPPLCRPHSWLLSCSSNKHGGLCLSTLIPLLSQVMHPGLWLEIPMRVMTSKLTCLVLGNSLVHPAAHLASPLGCLLAS